MDSDILYNISLPGDEHFEPQKYIDYPTVKEPTSSYNIEFPINKLLINRVEQFDIIQDLVSKKKNKKKQ